MEACGKNNCLLMTATSLKHGEGRGCCKRRTICVSLYYSIVNPVQVVAAIRVATRVELKMTNTLYD